MTLTDLRVLKFLRKDIVSVTMNTETISQSCSDKMVREKMA